MLIQSLTKLLFKKAKMTIFYFKYALTSDSFDFEFHHQQLGKGVNLKMLLSYCNTSKYINKIQNYIKRMKAVRRRTSQQQEAVQFTMCFQVFSLNMHALWPKLIQKIY